MSETTNKETVEKINAAFADGSTEGFLAFCTEDLVWTMAGEKTNRGKQAIREWMATCEGIEPPSFTIDTMIVEGDSVICHGDMTMKEQDGTEGKYIYCDIYKFDSDKVAELLSFVAKQKDESETGSANV